MPNGESDIEQKLSKRESDLFFKVLKERVTIKKSKIESDMKTNCLKECKI